MTETFEPGQTLTALELNVAFGSKQDSPLTPNDVPGVGGVSVSGTPTVGQALVATSASAAQWQGLPGGGGSSIATISAMANLAIPGSGAAVIVTDPLRGGTFAWDTANLSANVTADINQAIYVAPAAAPDGSLGAWVRQYTGMVYAPWFIFINDGVVTLGPPSFSPFGDYRSSYTTTVVSGTNNGPAWDAFFTWAQFESSQGRAVSILFPPGGYNHDLSTMSIIGTYGISVLHIVGYGAVFTNTYNESIRGASYLSSPWFFQCAPLVTGPLWTGDGVIPAGNGQPISFFINQTAVGGKSITLQTPAYTSYFSVGEWVLVGSLDIQMSGYPPNMHFNEFVQIASINSGTGIMTTVQPLKYQHRTDFTDVTATGSITYPCGKARVWKLNTTGYGYGAIPTPWDIDQTFEGIQVNVPPGLQEPGWYTVMSGRRFRTINWKGVGFSETVLGEHLAEGDHYWTLPEIDKLIGSIAFKDCIFDFASGAQSSSVERITYENCQIGGFAIGAKETLINNCAIIYNLNGAQLNLSASQGQAGPATFTNCKIETYLPNVIEPFVSDGNGILTVSIDASTPIICQAGPFGLSFLLTIAGPGQALLPAFAGVPGQYVALQPNIMGANGFAGDYAVGVIISYTTDGTYLYMNTTLPFSALPVWAYGSGVTGQLYVQSSTRNLFVNCNGSDQARMVSEACANGFDYWNRKTYVFSGDAAGGHLLGWYGELISADINVVNPSATSSDVIIFEWPTYSYNGTIFIADSGGAVLTINCGMQGHRIITKAMWLGKLGTDGMTVGGSAIGVLPSGRLVNDVAQWGATTFTSPDPTFLVEATFTFSTGQFRKLLTANLNGTSQGVILPTVGLLT
jgi:hypothetical protein